MATANFNSVTQAVHYAAVQLAALDWIDQEEAQQLGPLAEAVANAFMVVFYQAETGKATPADFREALDAVRQSLGT
ncbi:type I toxin-antitoxin system ptaRNA1 family toxin [Stutzerimonas chloritidismutans]|uniref:type I toxin-antitoxin system ptaRNA1 family toxin n=1 Tax=Stutzerimonas chloritidismutans TaxID=203192 RepID=UPI003F13C5E0